MQTLKIRNLTRKGISLDVKNDGVVSLNGPPMSGKTSVLRAVRQVHGDSYGLTDAQWSAWYDGGSIAIEPNPNTNFLIGPRSDLVDFRGPQAITRTLWTHMSPHSIVESMATVEKAFWVDRISPKIKVKTEISTRLASYGHPTNDLDLQIAELTKEKEKCIAERKKARAEINDAWPGILDQLRASAASAYTDKLMPKLGFAEIKAMTNQVKVDLDGDELSIRETSGSTPAVHEIALFMRMADAIQTPVIMLLDDEELMGLSGKYLVQTLRMIAAWILSREPKSYLWIAYQAPVGPKNVQVSLDS